jgi:uncharacterized membrane protein
VVVSRLAAALPALTALAAVGCGLVGGVFFAFSTFVMPALARLPAPAGIAVMQSINVTAVRPPLMAALFGTAAVCLLLAIAVLYGEPPAPVLRVVAACLLYVLGNAVVTMVCNVPLNDALARADPASAEGARLWQAYLGSWTAWNHVRTVTALVAAALLTFR